MARKRTDRLYRLCYTDLSLPCLQYKFNSSYYGIRSLLM